MIYYIVMGGTLYGQGRTSESALEDAMTLCKFEISPSRLDTNSNWRSLDHDGVSNFWEDDLRDMTVEDLIDNTKGKRHQVTNLDVVLTDTLAGVYVP